MIEGSAGPTRTLFLILAATLLWGCAEVVRERDGPPSKSVDVSGVADAVPRVEPKSRYGNPDSYVVHGRRYHTLDSSRGHVERGIASWYGKKFHGRRTSSGETYNMYAMSAAHKALPLPTYVHVTNLDNRRRVLVRVNDRGPFHANRIIDLSYAAASKLGILGTGTAFVEVRAIDPSASPAKLAAPAVQIEAVGSGTLYLQVGAFAYRVNAERLSARIGTVADALTRITEIIKDGRTLYRVQVGPLIDVSQADRLAFLLANAGIEDPHIVLE